MLRTALIIAAVAAVFALLGYWMFAPGSGAGGPLTEITDPAAIQKMVELSRPSVAVSENYVGDKVKLIGASVKNISDRSIRRVEVKMQFSDYEGKTIQEGVQTAYQAKQRSLAPGMESRFEIAFDNLPRSWNSRPPAMQVVKVGY